MAKKVDKKSYDRYEFILLVKSFNSATTSKDTLIKICKDAKIHVCFVNDIFDHLQNDATVQESIPDLREEIKKLQAENKRLIDKIKLLEAAVE